MQIIVLGGGMCNMIFMINLFEEMFKYGLKVIVSDDVGIFVVYKEVIKFVMLVFVNKRQLVNNIFVVGGVVKYGVLGKFSWVLRRVVNVEEVIGRNEKVFGIVF